MIPENKVTEIYFIIDEFFKEFDNLIRDYSLQEAKTRKRNRKFTMSQSEVMTILILFHSGAFKNLKSFYVFYVQKHMQKDFPETVSYNRFVELQRKVCVPLAVFVKMMCMVKCTGISFIDSTPLRSCHIKRERNNIRHSKISPKKDNVPLAGSMDSSST